jgi:hypothetical protein
MRYPQGIIFTLMLALQSNKERRQKAATQLISKLRSMNPAFIAQAETISTEIQRVAILQQEEWLEYMGEACRYYDEQQFDKICKLMYPLHRSFMKASPDSHNEILFYQKYSYRINEAFDHLNNYWNRKVPGPVYQGSNGLVMAELTANVMAIHEACIIYTELCEVMRKEMESMSTVNYFH